MIGLLVSSVETRDSNAVCETDAPDWRGASIDFGPDRVS